MTYAPELLAQANTLMQSLASGNDPDALQFDHDGCCVASFDDWVVEFRFNPAMASITMVTTLAQLAAPADASLMSRLLHANARYGETGGGVLSLGNDPTEVLWFTHLSLALDSHAFRLAVEGFLNRADAWVDSATHALDKQAGEAVPTSDTSNHVIRG
jgi:hypothetical protein